MPVLINQDSGLAEDLEQEMADRAVAAGTHQIPLNDPQGNPVTASKDQAKDFIEQGYSQPSNEQLQSLMTQAKYSTASEKVKTALEGAAESLSFGLSTGAERALGVSPEAIRTRRETNPEYYIPGQIGGLAASALLPGGAAKILGRAGETVARAVGLGAAESTLARIGSSAVKGAVETAIMSGGDEVSKMFASDPNQSVETAITDIGLSGLMGAGIGGAFGTVSPLWKATSESKLAKILQAIKDKGNGLEREIVPEAPEIADKTYQQIQGKFKNASPEDFINARAKSARSEFLTPYTPEDIKNYRLYLTNDNVGFALTPEGDLVSVFNNSGRQGAGKEAVIHGIAQGAKTLDALDGYLPQYYNKFGFNFKNAAQWDDSFAPKGWNYEKYGRPDVVYMEYPESLSRDPKQIAARFETIGPQEYSGSSDTAGSKELNGVSSQHGFIDWSTRRDLDLSKQAPLIEGAARNFKNVIDQHIERSGINIPPEVRAALGDNPETKQMFQTLQESTTGSGKKAQESLKKFRSQVNDALIGGLGKTPEELDALSGFSEHDAGSLLKAKVSSEIKEMTSPLSEKFNKIREKFSSAELNNAKKSVIAEQINKFAQDNGYYLLPGTAQEGLINKTINGLSKVTNLEELRKLQSQISEQARNPEMWQVGKGIRNALRNAEEDVVESKLGEEAPNLIAEHKAARQAYKSNMDLLEDLNDRLHVGKYYGPDSFLTALKEMAPEDVLRRLTPKNDAGLLNLMTEKFPQTVGAIKENFLNQALKAAGQKAVGEDAINAKTLFNVLDKWSPELKQFAMPEGASQKIDAIRGLIDAIPQRMNPSGTAKTLDALWSKVPAGAMGILSFMTGHNPLIGALLGEVGRVVGREVPDAAKLALLRFLGESQPINSTAFKSAVDLAASTIKGEALLNKASKSVFKAGQDILPQSLLPTPKTKEKLDKKIKELQSNNESLLNVGGETGYYLANHGAALGSVALRASNYLQALRPEQTPSGALDSKLQPSKTEMAKYNRAMDLVEQPLLVMKSIQHGNLTADDVRTIRMVYPALYQRMSDKLTSEMIDHISKGDTVPYLKRLSLSLFLGKALDSTMTPQAILSAQPQMQQPQQNMEAPHGQKMKGSLQALKKLPSMFATHAEAREQEKSLRNV